MDFLTVYDRQDGFKPDWKEKFGNTSLGVLRTAFGKTVVVTHLGKTEERLPQASEKAVAIAALILFSPVFLFLIPAGYFFTAASKTYGRDIPVKPKDPKAGPLPNISPAPKTPAPKSHQPKSPNPESPAPASTKKPEPKIVKPSFGLSEKEIESINQGENQPLNARFRWAEDIRAYISAYKEDMRVLWVDGVDFTREEDIFNGHNFKSIHLNNCRITAKQEAYLSTARELKLTNGTLANKESLILSLRHADTIDLSSNNLSSDALMNRLSYANVQTLNVANNALDDSFFDNLDEASNLKKIDLSHNKMTDAGLFKLAPLLHRYKEGIDLSFNSITLNGIKELSKRVEVSALLNLKCSSIDQNAFRQVLIDAAGSYASKARLLEAGFSLHELGINDAETLSPILAYCKDLKKLDASDLDLSDPKWADMIANHSSLKVLKLAGCGLTEKGLKKISRLHQLEILDIDRNLDLDEATVKKCFDGFIPRFVRNIQPPKRLPNANELNLFNSLLDETKRAYLQVHQRIFYVRVKYLSDMIDWITTTSQNIDKSLVRFNLFRRFGFELDEEKIKLFYDFLDKKPIDKEALTLMLFKLAEVNSIDKFIGIRTNKIEKDCRPTDFIVEQEAFFTKKGLIINDEIAKKIVAISSFKARLKGLYEFLAISEFESIRTLLLRERDRPQEEKLSAEELVNKLLDILSFSDLDKMKLKKDLMTLLQNRFSINEIESCLCKAAAIDNIMCSAERERALPDVPEEAVQQLTLGE